MRKSGRSILLFVLFSLLAIGTITFLFTIFPAGSGSLEEALFEEEIRDIYVSAEHANVTLLSSQNENTKVELDGNNGKHQLLTTLQDTQLTIEVISRSSFFNFSSRDPAVLTIHVPKSNSRNLKVQSDNGDLDFSTVEAYDLSAYTANGEIGLENVYAKFASVETANGQVGLNGVEAQGIDAVSSNGDIHLENINAYVKLTADTSNGSIDLVTSDLVYPIEFKTSNGDITIQTENKPVQGSFESTAINGQIDIFGDSSEMIKLEDEFPLIKASSENGNILVE